MALLPPGPYIFDVVALHNRKVSISGNPFFTFKVKLMGYDYYTFWLVSKAAHWVWREFTDDFKYLPAALVGRRLLFDISVVSFSSHPTTPHRNALNGPLAEVVNNV